MVLLYFITLDLKKRIKMDSNSFVIYYFRREFFYRYPDYVSLTV